MIANSTVASRKSEHGRIAYCIYAVCMLHYRLEPAQIMPKLNDCNSEYAICNLPMLSLFERDCTQNCATLNSRVGGTTELSIAPRGDRTNRRNSYCPYDLLPFRLV